MPERTPTASRRLTIASMARAIKRGWRLFLLTRPVSVTFAMIFSLIGVVILVGILRASFAPLVFPFAGAFLLVGPLLLLGYFALADAVARGEKGRFSHITAGFARFSPAMMGIALLCTVLFVVWIVDVAVLYGFIVGRTPEGYEQLLNPTDSVVAFLLASSLIGAILAFVIFAVSAFSVPLLYYRRADAVHAVVLSVGVVCRNILPCVLWGLFLTTTLVGSIIIFPLFLLTFPVLAYASHALYRELFPE